MSMIRKLFAGAALFAALLVLAAPAEAQRPGRGGPGGRGGSFGLSPLMLLGLEPVQKELELSDEQMAQIKEITSAGRGERPEFDRESFRDLSDEERRERFEEMRKQREKRTEEMQGKIDGVLLQMQKDRLQQISIQIRGLGALNDAAVAKKLGITDEQKEKMAAAREEIQTKMREQARELFQNRGEDGERKEIDREAIREKFMAMRADAEKAVLAVLSEEQKAQFEKMKGEKFEIDMRQLFQGRQRGQRRGPQGDRPERGSQDTD